MIALVRQSSRHDAEIANLRTEFNSKLDNLNSNLRTELRTETRAVLDRIDKAQAEWREENRAALERIDKAQAEWREENRAYRQAIENRINLDERVRTVEQRTAPSPDDAPAD